MEKNQMQYIIRKATSIENYNIMPESKIFNLMSSKFSLANSFMQTSIILNNNMEPANSSKQVFTDYLAQVLSPLYNKINVLENRPINSECKDILKTLVLEDKVSEQHISLHNLISVSASLHEPINSKPRTYKFNISKILRNDKNDYVLSIFNTASKTIKKIMMDKIIDRNKIICQNHSFGKISGKYFIYDNQGTITVICIELKDKIIDLNLPDCRQDPVFYVSESDPSQTILFAVGGYKRSDRRIPLDTVAVYYLNFKEISKMIHCEPVLYIKMKYPRLNPIVFKQNYEGDAKIIFLGGNHWKRFSQTQNSLERKSFDANGICETISLKTVKECIYNIDFIQSKFLFTDESLIIKSNDDQKLVEKLKFYIDAGCVVKYKDSSSLDSSRKTNFIVGIGEKRNEIWIIERIDFIEHKICLERTKFKLLSPKNQNYSSFSMKITGKDLYFFEKQNLSDDKVKKLNFYDCFFKKNKKDACGSGDCRIF